MNFIHAQSLVKILYGRLLPVSILGALLPMTVFSQTATLRGTAKINDKFVVRGVMVVLTAVQSHASAGKPRPAWVGVDGEYRIENVSPGIYDLRVAGKPIKDKVISGVKVAEGSSNIQNITLERADQLMTLHSKVLDPRGRPMKNAKVGVYSAALPPSVCEKCMLAETRLNHAGEAANLKVARGQDYMLAVSVHDKSNKGKVRMIAANTISIGTQAQARVELQLSEGPQPVLTAKLLQDRQRAPIQGTTRPSSELANTVDTTNPAGSRTVASGQELKVKGVVTRRDAETFIVRDMNGVDTMVRLGDSTSVKTKGGFLRGGTNYGQTSILRGLNIEVEGRGNTAGELDAEKVRFSEADMRVARAVESRAAPLEEKASDTETKLTQVEANAQRLSGQLEELAAVANAGRGGSKAAQATADAAVAGVNATNERISALDDYTPQTTAAVLFRSGSAVLLPEAKASLDEIAKNALNAKGFVLEVAGFADSRGSISLNRALSQRRTDAVIRYLVENHNIPLRRIVTPYGYGESNPVAENTSREGRAQNRRVEVKLLVNKGLTTPAPTMNPNPG